jgi:hypothetical protein
MTTYVSLVNELLRRLNEVTLDTEGSGFDTARNVQALAKDSINNSIRSILQTGQEWPFLRVTYTQPLTAGVNTYSFPSNYSSADWESLVFLLSLMQLTKLSILTGLSQLI